MKAIATRSRLALAAGASFLLLAGSALAQDAWMAEPGIDSFQQIIPSECFDPATGAFSTAFSPAVCGVFEGAPGTEGGVGPTGAVTAAGPMEPMPDAFEQPVAPGIAAAPGTWDEQQGIAAAPAPGAMDQPAVAADTEAQLPPPSPQSEAMAPPEGDLPPPPPSGLLD